MPENVRRALTDDSVEKWAFNAQFERVCLSAWFRRNHPEEVKELNKKDKSLRGFLNPKAWKCSRIWAAYMGMPLSLEDVGALLKLENQKMAEGKELIRYFCGPCKPTKTNEGRTRNLPAHDMAKWRLFKSYNKRDVEVEMAIQEKLRNFPCLIICGMNTTWIKKSMTAGLLLMRFLLKRRFPSMTDRG